MDRPSAFRRGNDAIARSAERAGFTEQPINFICECADETCFEPIVLTLEEYRRIRADKAIVTARHPTGRC
jgi:hypothetical protein